MMIPAHIHIPATHILLDDTRYSGGGTCRLRYVVHGRVGTAVSLDVQTAD